MANPYPALNVRPVRAFSDNYIWLIESPLAPTRLVAVDPGEAAPVLAHLASSGASLAAILLTHHHPDHIGGVAELLRHVKTNAPARTSALASTSAPANASAARETPLQVIGPDDARISNCTQTVGDGDRCRLPELGLEFETLSVPGHTLSHIAFWGHGALFSGDTLFSAGCGRMFEGTPTQMNASLDRLRRLPPETRMYCGHEYTAANLRFALTVDPHNAAIAEHIEVVAQLRADGNPSLPSPLSLETRINPFLRCDDPIIRAAAESHAAKALPEPSQVFAVLRAWKDQFR